MQKSKKNRLHAEHRCQIKQCYCKDGQPIEEVKEVPARRKRPFSETHPEIASLWDYENNCDWEPDDFGSGSHVIAWWNCPAEKDHRWSQTINLCCRLKGCPFCLGYKLSKKASLAFKYPDIAKSWHPKLNKCKATEISFNANYLAWWLCLECGSEYQMKVAQRIKCEFGCKQCAWGESIDLNLYPNALRLFDKQKNKGLNPSNLSTNGRFWWRCSKAPDHRWNEGFEKRTPDKTCPFCTGLRPSSTNNLSLDDELKNEFHPLKNGDLKPEDFALNSTYGNDSRKNGPFRS